MDTSARDLDRAALLGLKLLGNAAAFRWRRLAGRPCAPQAMSIEVTRRCIARCLMCGIWRSPIAAPELSVAEWRSLLSHPLLADLRELDVTGGEPYLRDDLPELVAAVADLHHTNLSRLRSVAITTNGLLTGSVLAATREMARDLERAGLDLVVVCALDAVGPRHDEIRGVPQAWRRLEETLAGLLSLRDERDNLVLGIKTTVVPGNVDELERIADYASSRALFAIISPFIVTGGRYLNADLEGELAFTQEQLAALAEFYRRPGAAWDYHRRSMAAYLETGRMRRPCSCGFNYFFVRSTGELLLCPLLERDAGNVREADLDTLWRSDAAAGLRRGVGRYDACRRCTEPGLERYSLPCEGLAYLRLLRELGPSRFLRLHEHLGLDKYF